MNNSVYGGIVLLGISLLFVIGLFGVAVFLAIDWTTGEHGRLTITAVDKNLFGTYTVYSRNSDSMSGSEALEVQYCVDAADVELAQRIKDAIGKPNSTLVYPEKRFGFFWFDKCITSPVKEIK